MADGSEVMTQGSDARRGRGSSEAPESGRRSSEESGGGILYVVATPIGNLSDITQRAVEVLRSAHLIACEDTRKSRTLLQRRQISTEVMSLHKFSEARKTQAILERLERGENVALISDAGTPALSDPGTMLVRAARVSGYRVTPIPGASAITAALSVSGMDASSFVYLGFAPRKDDQRARFFNEILLEDRTCIFFESPKRLTDSLRVAARILGGTHMVVMRELTKIHEEMLHGSASEILGFLEMRESVRGEIIVVVEGSVRQADSVDLERAVETLMQEGFTGKKLADEARRRYGVRKSDAYDKFLELKNAT
ncbi:MAG: 16S rRNA (cytidine(1402)-2'-O)-methyltransferase [Desulfomonilaceae bacterium]|nr:16S rRNA (cytidine(1402)-2'-O)-methyltransferase [Desulfomonilaceae bacterium]